MHVDLIFAGNVYAQLRKRAECWDHRRILTGTDISVQIAGSQVQRLGV